jgi:hypothetical protein
MTEVELRRIVRTAVAEWFDRMQATGELPSDKPVAVAERQKTSETQLMRAIRKNDPLFLHLLEGDEKHAKEVVNLVGLGIGLPRLP